MGTLVEQKGKAERCLMPENNMAGKIFSLLYVCWGLDVNVGFGLKAEGKRCLHTGLGAEDRFRVIGGELGFGLALLTLLK